VLPNVAMEDKQSTVNRPCLRILRNGRSLPVYCVGEIDTTLIPPTVLRYMGDIADGKAQILAPILWTQGPEMKRMSRLRTFISRQARHGKTPIRISEREYKEYILLKREAAQETLQRYWRYAEGFLDWLGTREINEQTLGRYNAALRRRYARNSRIVVNSAINWLLDASKVKDSEGEPLRLRIPSKETSPHGRLVGESEWERIARYARTRLDLRESVLVHLLRESLLRPSDIVRIRLPNLDLESDPPAIRNLVQRKTQFVASPRISQETGRLVKKYLKAYKPLEYLFEAKPAKPFHRRWPTEVIKRVTDSLGIQGVTPRTFRRTGATQWQGKVATLQLQGGWKDPKTIYNHYLKYREEDHIEDFKATFSKQGENVDDANYFA